MIELSEMINLNTNKPIFRSEIRNVCILLMVFEDNEEKTFYWRPSWILDRHFEFFWAKMLF